MIKNKQTILQGALNSWSEWGLGLTRPPTIVKPMVGGLTNLNYLLESDGCHWVLRLNADNSLQLGIDRAVEQRILISTAQAGLSPKQYYCSPQLGILVSEYLPAWQPIAITEQLLVRLAKWMHKLHQLEVADVPVVDYLEYTEGYVQRLQANGQWSEQLTMLRAEQLPNIHRFQSSPVATARLCHHDPSPPHWRLQNGELCLIDWEYAALRDPACDLALLVDSWQLSPKQVLTLLSCYGGSIDHQRLIAAQQVCSYINQLWFALQKR